MLGALSTSLIQVSSKAGEKFISIYFFFLVYFFLLLQSVTEAFMERVSMLIFLFSTDVFGER